MSDPLLTATLAEDLATEARLPARGATIGRFLVIGSLGRIGGSEARRRAPEA